MERTKYHSLVPAQVAGWVPVGAYAQGGQLRVEWNRLDGERFHEPFFADSCARLRRRPFNSLFRRETTIDELTELAAVRPGLPPRGFIFHTSRCGSTLLSQMLAALTCNVVLSEAAPIDTVLRFRRGDTAVSPERRMQWLRAMISALGQAIHPDARQLFVKFDSWSIFDLPLIRAAYPAVPWVFVYRDPLEVLSSHMRQRGLHMIPGMIDPALFAITRAEAVAMPAEEYCSRVLGCICETAAQQIVAHGGLAVNYTELPHAMETTIAAWFGVTWRDTERVTLRRVAQRDAKNPYFEFSPDQDQKKRLSASPALRAAVRTWAAPGYGALERLRAPGSA